MKKYIVVNIGCIECKVSSNIVGVFDDEKKAKKIAKDLEKRFEWRQGGDNQFEVFPMPEINIIHKEYLK